MRLRLIKKLDADAFLVSYGSFIFKQMRGCRYEFFKASGVQSTQQVRKIYTCTMLLKIYLVRFELTIL